MDNNFSIVPIDVLKLKTASQLRDCNEYTEQFGLCLKEEEINKLVEKRFEALKDSGRIEFGSGILKKLIYAFCDSPYITNENYVYTIAELQDSFYYFKNESEDLIPDDDLICFMKESFDNVCEGSLDYLNGTSLEDLCRETRNRYKDTNGNLF